MIYCYCYFDNGKPPLINYITKFYKSKLYLCYKSIQNNKVYTVGQGRSQDGHVGHCSKMTPFYECFFKLMSKARIPDFDHLDQNVWLYHCTESFYKEQLVERAAWGPQKPGALGHGPLGLCVNPSLSMTTIFFHNKIFCKTPSANQMK